MCFMDDCFIMRRSVLASCSLMSADVSSSATDGFRTTKCASYSFVGAMLERIRVSASLKLQCLPNSDRTLV